MVKKSTNAYKRTRVAYIINIVRLLHVSATLLAILWGVYYKEFITKVYEPMHKCKMLNSNNIWLKIHIKI